MVLKQKISVVSRSSHQKVGLTASGERCLFVWLKIEMSLISTRGCKCWPMLSTSDFRVGRVSIVPHLLRHRTSIIAIFFEGPPHLSDPLQTLNTYSDPDSYFEALINLHRHIYNNPNFITVTDIQHFNKYLLTTKTVLPFNSISYRFLCNLGPFFRFENYKGKVYATCTTTTSDSLGS